MWVRLEIKQIHQFVLELLELFLLLYSVKLAFPDVNHFLLQEADVEIHHLQVALPNKVLIQWVKVNRWVLVDCHFEEVRKFDVVKKVDVVTFRYKFNQEFAPKLATVQQVVTVGQEQQVVAFEVLEYLILI